MSAVLEVESTLTDRYQTTVPEPVRRVLQLAKRDAIQYQIQPDGSVLMRRAAAGSKDEDAVLGAFLNFLAHDMAQQPQRLATLDASLVARVRALTAPCAVDLDAALDAADE